MPATLDDWMDRTTTHGVPDLHRSETTWGRVGWMCTLLLFLSIAIDQVITVIENLALQKWDTRVYEESEERIQHFPIITLCNYDRIGQKKRTEYDMTDDMLIFLYNNMPANALVGCGSECIRGKEAFHNWRVRNNFSTLDVFMNFGHQCSETVYQLRRRDLVLSTQCAGGTGTVRFEKVMNMEFGLCHRITVNISQDIVTGGSLDGVTMLLNVNADDYANITVKNYLDVGLVMQVSYQTSLKIGQWISLAPGFHHMVVLRQTHRRLSYSDLTKTLRNVFSVDYMKPPCLFNYPLRYLNVSFTKDLCTFECAIAPTVKKCECLPFMTGKLPMCEADQLAACTADIPPILWKSVAVDVCSSVCGDPCDMQEITATVSMSKFPSVTQMKSGEFWKLFHLTPNDSFSTITRNFLLVDVFFESLTVTVSEDYEAVTITDAMNASGGALSLWAGISLITIVQAFVYLLCGLYTYLRSYWRKRKMERSVNEAKTKSKSSAISNNRQLAIKRLNSGTILQTIKAFINAFHENHK